MKTINFSAKQLQLYADQKKISETSNNFFSTSLFVRTASSYKYLEKKTERGHKNGTQVGINKQRGGRVKQETAL